MSVIMEECIILSKLSYIKKKSTLKKVTNAVQKVVYAIASWMDNMTFFFLVTITTLLCLLKVHRLHILDDHQQI